jgi:hypothetical protein
MDTASAWTQRTFCACVAASLLEGCGGSQSLNGSAWSVPQVMAQRIAPARFCCRPEILTAPSAWIECVRGSAPVYAGCDCEPPQAASIVVTTQTRDGGRCRFGVTYGIAEGPLRGTFTASGGWFDSLRGCELHESFKITSVSGPLSGTISGFTTRCHSNGLPNSLKYKIEKKVRGTVYIRSINNSAFYETFFNFSR